MIARGMTRIDGGSILALIPGRSVQRPDVKPLAVRLVPEHGYVIIVWKSPTAALPSARPRIAAVGRDGSVLY